MDLIKSLDPTIIGIAGGVAGFILFMLIRIITLWYWRINKIVELLAKIESNTSPKEAKEETKEENSKA